MSLLWPTRVAANPKAIQVLARIVHYAGAVGTIYYLGMLLKYLSDAKGSPDWNQVAKWVVLAGLCWFGGRGIRFVFGKE
jgi:hypothetical protein